MVSALFILALVVGLYMAWCIGANDVSNAMGTSVGSKALTLSQAVLVAAVLEFSGAYFFGSYVSDTVQKGIVNPDVFSSQPMHLVYGMIASLIAAGVWLQLATFKGWPVSTTHSIIGALVGFGAVAGSMEAVYWHNVAYIAVSWLISPVCGAILGFAIFSILRSQIFYSHNPVLAAKRLTPLFAFLVLGVLTFAMCIKGLKNVHLELSFFETLMLSVGVGAVAALLSYLWVRNIQPQPATQPPIATVNPKVLLSLEKARKHIERAKAASRGNLYDQMSGTLEDIDELTYQLTPHVVSDSTSAEYHSVERIFALLQILTACLMAFAHGANDVANAIGPLSAAIGALETGIVSVKAEVPEWILAMGGFGIVLGLATWGWRVIETIGKKITELTPTRGFAAEFGAATTIVIATGLGLPISTTHTLVGAVLGVGLARGIGALNLSTIRDIILSWIVTLPAGASLAIGFYYLLKLIFEG